MPNSAETPARAMVLAAGLGTRLRPLTNELPKPLVPVLGMPVIAGTLALLAEAGIVEVVVNTHYLPERLEAGVRAGAAARDLALQFLHEPVVLGTGGGLRNALAALGSAPTIVLVNGDTLLDFDLAEILRAHRESGAEATLLLRPNPDPAAYAPVLTDAAMRVHRIAGRPESGAATESLLPWLFAGVHVLERTILDRLPEGVSDINRTLHPALIAAGLLVRGHLASGIWSDIGTPDRLLEANLLALARPPAHLRRLAVREGIDLTLPGSALGPGIVREGDAAVARSAVGADVVLSTDSRVEDSVLLPGTVVGRGTHLRRTIVAAGTAIAPGRTIRDALVVGDEIVPMGSAVSTVRA